MTPDELHDKVLDLVWYARKPRGNGKMMPLHEIKTLDNFTKTPDDIIKGMLASMMKVEGKYPDDVADLNGESADWHHGFNSGVLATLRFIDTYNSEGEESATEQFPELYT